MTPEYRIKAEKQITAYLKKYDVEKIKYMQVEQTFQDFGVSYAPPPLPGEFSARKHGTARK